MENEKMMEQLLARARVALAELEGCTQTQIDAYCKAACLAFRDHAEELAKEAVEETGMGNVPDKIIKNTGAPEGVWYAIKGKKSVGVIGHDEAKGLSFVARPKGILGCVIPTTNPNITILFNGIYGLKGRNVMLVAPHPRAKKTSFHTCQIINEALEKAGAPKNIFQCMPEPNIELTQLMMRSVNVILATGGTNMVNAAYSSGRPAYGVGPGNSQTVFDPDYADLEMGIEQTILGNSFDNGIICACNRSFITPRAIADRAVEIMKAKKVYYIDNDEERDRIRELLFPNGYGAINGKPVGQSVQRIAEMAGIQIPADTSIIVVRTHKSGLEESLCREKMVPVAAHLVAEDFEDAVAMAKANLLAEGAGHSSVVHSCNEQKIEYAALQLPVSRLLVNCPGIFCANPALSNGLVPTGTLGCGSWGNNSLSENLSWEHLVNISRVARVLPEEKVPSADDVWNGDAAF